MLQDFLTDFNTAKPRSSLIPAGTIVKVLVKICPGGHEPNGLLTKSKNTGSIYLNLEFTVVEGPYSKRKIYQIFGIQGSKLNENGEDVWGEIGRSMIRSILESARNIYPHDDREEANLARKIKSISELNGLECLVKIGMETSGYGEKNKIISVITPEYGSYASFMKATVIALFTIIRTDRNMLLACYSHKHISYRIRTIIRKAIIGIKKLKSKKIVKK